MISAKWIVPALAAPSLALALARPAGAQSNAPASQAEPASAGAPVATTQGAVIGPQPGPARPLPQVHNPVAGQPAAITEGRRLFVWFNCYGCHGGRAGGGMGPSLRDKTWLYGKTDQDVFNSIAEGRQHGMPSWGTKLPDEQIWKLTAYIKSLGTRKEPDPPPANPVLPHLGRSENVGPSTPGGNPPSSEKD